MKKLFNAWMVFLLLFIAIYTYRLAGKTGWHSKGLWLGAVICVGLVFLDAYLEAVRESGQYSRFERCVTKIWAWFAVAFFSTAALTFAGIAVWLLVMAVQFHPAFDSSRRADVYAILRDRPVCDCDAETPSKEFELLIFSASLPHRLPESHPTKLKSVNIYPHTSTPMQKSFPIIPLFLTIFIAALIVWSGINPSDRAVWYAEIVPVSAVFIALIATYRLFRFSNLAYVFMSFWLIMHTIGAHYTFADVPFDWANRLLAPFLGENRNHFDRVGHYIIGFYAYPMAEWLLRRKLCRLPLALFFALFFIMSVAATYEIIEWQYAVIDGGQASIEVLGSQGDIWDAQKDMLSDTLGALTSLFIFLFARPDKRLGGQS